MEITASTICSVIAIKIRGVDIHRYFSQQVLLIQKWQTMSSTLGFVQSTSL